MKNGFVQGLYEAAKSDHEVDPITGIPKIDETKLKRFLNRNKKLGIRNKEAFRKGEVKFHTCPRYDPCPICDKCRNKASHLYVACRTCQIPICSHTYDDRDHLIKRRNFVQYVDENTMTMIKEIDKQVTGGLNG